MALTEYSRWVQYFDVPVPEGYYLRHIANNCYTDKQTYGGVFLYERARERPVGYFDVNTNMANMETVFTIHFGGKHSMHDRDLTALLVRACAYDRVMR